MKSLVVVSCMLTLAFNAGAGVYPLVPKAIEGKANSETNPFEVNPDGVAKELPFDAFRLRFAVLMNAADANPARAATNTDRKAFMQRVEARGTRMANARAAAGLAADWLALGKPEEAVKALVPFTREPTPDFLAMMNLSATYAQRGEWDLAARYHEEALFRIGMPADLPGTKPEQRIWLKKVEQKYITRWIALQRLASSAKPDPALEQPLDLFGIKFVNKAGVYEPGQLADEQKKKLPPDAIAIVQQMLLWAPWDTGLLWLLAELYAMDGKVQEADVLFFQCTDGRQFSNRTVLMNHRAIVREAVTNLPKEVETKDEPGDKDSGLPPLKTVLVVVGVFVPVALGLLYLQVRRWMNKQSLKR